MSVDLSGPLPVHVAPDGTRMTMDELRAAALTFPEPHRGQLLALVDEMTAAHSRYVCTSIMEETARTI